MKTKDRRFWALVMVGLHVMLMETGFAQGTFVMPSDRVDAMGGSVVLNPMFRGSDPTVVPYRYQEAFGYGDISLPYGQYYITGVNFRLAQKVAGGNSLNAVLPDIEFRMSTSLRVGVDLLASEYDFNHGPDATVVVPRGPLRVTGTFDPSKAVQAFSVRIPFSQPFLYNRGEFNTLLLDIINYGGSPFVVGFDTMGLGFDSVSIVAGHSLTGGSISTVGLVAQVEYSPIPEPSILSLTSVALGYGLCWGIWQAIRRRSGRRAMGSNMDN